MALFWLSALGVVAFLSALATSEILLLPLSHSLSATQTQYTNTHHLLKSTSARSAARFRRQRQVSVPLSPGSDYTLSLTLGTKTVSLYMDTGSDLVWFPCHPFECILCEGKSDPATTPPPPNIPRNAAVSCASPACAAAHSSSSSSDLCAAARCPLEAIETGGCRNVSCPPFYYAYADGSLVATLKKQSLSIPTSSSPSLRLRNFTFGCAHTALAEPVGVAGFGRGLLSMPNQLAALSPRLGNHFSYCLVAHSFEAERVRRPSPLILGRNERDEFVYTTMLDNPKRPYLYCVGLAGISVGKSLVAAPQLLQRVDRNGNGGMAVDSGTTFTMLPSRFYSAVVEEFDRRVGRVNARATAVEEATGLRPCYHYRGGIEVPGMTLHFAGNESGGVVLPRRNFFYEFADEEKKMKVGCLMVMDAGEDEAGPAATLGNYQQQGFEVVYDLERNRLGFARRHCSSLWHTLNFNHPSLPPS